MQRNDVLVPVVHYLTTYVDPSQWCVRIVGMSIEIVGRDDHHDL